MNLGKLFYGSRRTGHDTQDVHVRRIILTRYAHRCQGCHRKYVTNKRLATLFPNKFFTKLHIDHIVPFSHGGRNHIDNYQPMCAECNLIKSNTLPEE